MTPRTQMRKWRRRSREEGASGTEAGEAGEAAGASEAAEEVAGAEGAGAEGAGVAEAADLVARRARKHRAGCAERQIARSEEEKSSWRRRQRDRGRRRRAAHTNTQALRNTPAGKIQHTYQTPIPTFLHHTHMLGRIGRMFCAIEPKNENGVDCATNAAPEHRDTCCSHARSRPARGAGAGRRK